MRNPCKECIYYISENNTCQSKKCATAHEGYVTFFDRLFCEPCKPPENDLRQTNHVPEKSAENARKYW